MIRRYRNRQSGQTLIETITALYILTMALVSGLGVALYATTNSAQSKDEIIAANLAREGLEVVRMMRDTNWMSAQNSPSVADLYATSGGCTYSSSSADNRPCYPDGFNAPYDLESSASSDTYRVVYDPTAPTGWTLDTRNGNESYLLCLQPDGTYRHNTNGLGGIICDNSYGPRYARRVTITTGNTAPPYTGDQSNPAATSGSAPWGGHSPEKIITSTVVWQGRNCPAFPADPTSFDPVIFAQTTRCKVVMTERLTNWKDYQ